MNNTKIPLIKIPLSREAHNIAEHFAAQQATPLKGRQVYLNTLAVYAVHQYLKWLKIATDLNKSDSWNPICQTLSDVADLVLNSIGQLECRRVLPQETSFLIPPQATENRIGYVAIQFDENLNEVSLLGFIKTVNISHLPVQISLDRLQPLEDFLDYISAYKIPINLHNWLNDRFESGWQTIEDLFRSSSLALGVRNEPQFNNKSILIRRGKQIDLGSDDRVALILTFSPSSTENEWDINLQVYPIRQLYLPPNLELIVLDESGIPFADLEARSRDEDLCLQLALSGEQGEQFSVRLTLGDVSITEDFII